MIEINKCKLIPGVTADWGEITGNIENQKDLVSYISTHGGGKAEWGSISGVLADQVDLMNMFSSYATRSWVGSQRFATETYVTSAVSGMATESWVQNQGYLSAVPSGYATESWVESQGYITASTLPSDIATESYVTSALSGYATESWVQSQGYLTSHQDLSPYATMSWVSDQGYLSAVPSGYATESWVSDQGYLTAVPSEYATQSWVSSQEFITSSALSGYATESWVSSQQFITSSALSGYATESYVQSFCSDATENCMRLVDKDLDWPVVDRPSVSEDSDDYNSEGYILTLSEDYDTIEEDGDEISTKTVRYLLCYDQNLFQKEFRYHEVDGEWELQSEYTNEPLWNGSGWDAVRLHCLPDDPEFQDKLDGYPMEYYMENWRTDPIGELDYETMEFNGFKMDENYNLGKYKIEGFEQGSLIVYEETFTPYLTGETGLKWADEDTKEDLLAGVDLTFCDLIERPNDWNPEDGYYAKPYVIGLVDESGSSKATFVDGDGLFFKYVEHIEQGSLIVDRVFDGEYYQQWPGWEPLEKHNVESDPDYADSIPEGYPITEGVRMDAPLNIGYWHIDDNWAFSGIRISEDGVGIYAIEPVEDGSEITYEENYDPFATESYVTSAISSAIGVAMSITNEILS